MVYYPSTIRACSSIAKLLYHIVLISLYPEIFIFINLVWAPRSHRLDVYLLHPHVFLSIPSEYYQLVLRSSIRSAPSSERMILFRGYGTFGVPDKKTDASYKEMWRGGDVAATEHED